MKCPHCGREVKLWEALVPKLDKKEERTEVRSTGQLGAARKEERAKKRRR